MCIYIYIYRVCIGMMERKMETKGFGFRAFRAAQIWQRGGMMRCRNIQKTGLLLRKLSYHQWDIVIDRFPQYGNLN